MDKTSITHRALKNISFSLIGFGWPILIAIFVTPIVVIGLGVKEYGIYVFISTLISIVGLIEIGVSSAFAKFIAERHSTKNYLGLSSLFKTGNTILFFIGIFGGLLIISTLYIGNIFFPEAIVNYMHYYPAFISAGIMFFINSMVTLYIVIPTALQRVDVGTKIGIAFFTFQQTVIVLGVIFHIGLNNIFIALAVLYACFYFLYRDNSTHILPVETQKDLHQFGFDKRELLQVYTFGFGVFFNNIAGSLLAYLDKAIIPVFIGPSNLTYYSLAGSIASKTPGLSQTFTSVVFPMTASFESVGDRERVKTLYIRTTRLIAVFSTAITVTIISFPYLMLKYWISVDVAEKTTGILVILALTNWIISLSGTLSGFLTGLGRLKQLTMTSLTSAFINAILLFIFLPKMGIIGAAWAYLFCFIPYLLLLYWIEYKLLNLTGRKIHYVALSAKLLSTGVIVFVLNQLIFKQFIYNFPTVLVFGAVSGSLFLGIYFIFGFFEKEDVRDILGFAKKTLRRG
ncbi:MAG: oligosaccharide flippase family protein [Candidatus Pacebacteria bacterium]|nr:oligosaccharide flippase family protein [Candidatus Paceibacterota bacterium]MBP9818516.1 oligosaccharide flippase family protein [Candidatus Paceibacterota bacterium]